jgi:fucose 4-O-acetylase-like acetyltransferase
MAMPVDTTASRRLLYIDNIRWVLIVLVLSMHAVDTYSPFGNWYYTDPRPVGLPTVLTFVTWQSYLQAFFMGLLFFIAGLHAPASLLRRGRAGYLKERAVRLGAPVLLYMLVIGPVTEYWIAGSWSATHSSFVREWWRHIADGEVWSENGPLWFCVALLVFCVVHAFTAKSSRPIRPMQSLSPERLPAFALAMAICEFVLRLALPPHAVLLNMHLADFAQYVLMFAAGIWIGRRQGLSLLSDRSGLRIFAALGVLGAIGWWLLIVFGGALKGNTDVYGGGWHWQAAGFALWESCTCIAFSCAMLVMARRFFDRQGRFAAFMSANAFAVYVFHPPLLIAVARLLHHVAWPPLALAILLTLGAAIVSFAFASLVARRLPWLRELM